MATRQLDFARSIQERFLPRAHAFDRARCARWISSCSCASGTRTRPAGIHFIVGKEPTRGVETVNGGDPGIGRMAGAA